jgi:sugar/nucleoside kinase (ribokinase family)
MPVVLVIGDVMTDIVAKLDGPIAVGADRRATVRTLAGGAGANQACWLARENVATRFVARVGHEDHARQTADLAAYGVDARLGADPTQPTGALVTLVSPDGERSFLTDRGANLKLQSADLPHALLDGVDLVHVSGYALFEPGPREAVIDFLAEVERRKIPFAVDPASYSFLQEVGSSQFLDWTRKASILFPNEDEGAILTNEHSLDAQLKTLTKVYPLVVLKRGSKGAAAAEAATGHRWSVPAPDAKVVDTSGAGDAFLGGFLGEYLRGEAIKSALQRAVTLGSLAVTMLGARPPSPAPALLDPG